MTFSNLKTSTTCVGTALHISAVEAYLKMEPKYAPQTLSNFLTNTAFSIDGSVKLNY
jgi:hypothetical protein